MIRAGFFINVLQIVTLNSRAPVRLVHCHAVTEICKRNGPKSKPLYISYYNFKRRLQIPQHLLWSLSNAFFNSTWLQIFASYVHRIQLQLAVTLNYTILSNFLSLAALQSSAHTHVTLIITLKNKRLTFWTNLQTVIYKH